MPIPQYTNDGVLPPFVGATPGEEMGLMAPYKVTPLEVVEHLGQSRKRVKILKGWFAHRADLRRAGFVNGYQWLDGSFVEDKEPNDLDVVTFLYIGPPSFADVDSGWIAINQNAGLFNQSNAKQTFVLDAFFVDLLDPIELVVETARYWLGLFSHQRVTMIWKGMLQVRLEDQQADDIAFQRLAELEQLLPPDPPIPALNLSLFEAGGLADAS